MTIHNKLQLGLERLLKAGDNPDILGLALISLHSALEEYFRSCLASNSSVPLSEREIISDPRRMQWKGLLDLMQQYGGLNNDQRQYIFRMNRFHQHVVQGNSFIGTRSELEQYANFVRDFVANGSSSTRTNENHNNSSQQTNDLRLDMQLSSQEAVSGTEKQIRIPQLEKCEICNAKGLDRSGNRCSTCNGDGRIQKIKKLNVTIPAGVSSGTCLRVVEEGDAGIRGASAGDLYIKLDIVDR